VLSNHDVERHATRLAPRRADGMPDAVRGLARARAATLAMLALPGSAYLYQGEELGLPEVHELAPEHRRDPVFARSGGAEPGRDGCRVPLPWSDTEPSYGFGPGPSSWLPQPAAWAELSAERQDGDPGSTLSLYRRALALRRAEPALGDGPLRWLTTSGELLAFVRPGPQGDVVVALNLGEEAVRLPEEWGRVALASNGGSGGVLAPDAAVWLVPS
jgi:alpha-glucosidase